MQLKGNALAHFLANEEEYMLLTIQELRRSLVTATVSRHKRLSKPLQILLKTYCDKLKNLARPLLPSAVPQKEIVYGED
jgi:hypothetical protein